MNNLEEILNILKQLQEQQAGTTIETVEEQPNRFKADGISVSKGEVSSLSKRFTDLLNVFGKLANSEEYVADLQQSVNVAEQNYASERVLESRSISQIPAPQGSIGEDLAGVLSGITKEIDLLSKSIQENGLGSKGGEDKEKQSEDSGSGLGSMLKTAAIAGAVALGGFLAGSASPARAAPRPSDGYGDSGGGAQKAGFSGGGGSFGGGGASGTWEPAGATPRITRDQSVKTSKYSDALSSNIEAGIKAAQLRTAAPSTGSDGSDGYIDGDTGGGSNTGTYEEVGQGGTGAWRRDAAFISGVNDIARDWNTSARDILGMMHAESGIDPQARNSNGGATGLIQFMPDTARALGTTTDALYRMNRVQQLPWVRRYFTMARLPQNATAGQLYATVFLPAYNRRPNNFVVARKGAANDAGANRSGSWYSGNKGLDLNRSGTITVGELGQRVSQKRQEIGLGASSSTGGYEAAPQGSGGGGRGAGGGGAGRAGGGTGGGGGGGTRIAGTSQFLVPVRPSLVITSRFGPRNLKRPPGASKDHGGVDYAGGRGTGEPIYASAGGVVTFAGWRNAATGYLVVIQHEGPLRNYDTRYAHLHSFRVREGQRVNQGQHIAAMGNTGRSSGPHLHFEIRQNGTKVNPLNYVKHGRVMPDPNATEPTNEDSGRNLGNVRDTGPLPTPRTRPQVDVPSAEVAIANKIDECKCPPPIVIGGGQGSGPNPLQYLSGIKPPSSAKPVSRNPVAEYRIYFAA